MPKPVLMAVDDDPVAIARMGDELRSRYGRDYEVVCLNSGADALAELDLRRHAGGAPAVVLAEPRLPDVSGADVLARAKVLHPRSKLGLLVEFGDWGDDATAAVVRRPVSPGD